MSNGSQFEQRNSQNDRPSRDQRDSKSDGKVDHDTPPFSRLFVLCSKKHTQEELKDAFSSFGIVEDVWIIRDRNTKESRGVAYIKFSKMSEATLAVEQMDGKKMDDSDNKPLKVIIAQPKSGKTRDDFDDDTTLTRLFISIPRDSNEDNLREHFRQFGDVDHVQMIKDKKSGSVKSGFVKFNRAHDAAKAVEGADSKYRAVIAESKSAKMKREHSEVGTRHVPNLGNLGNLGSAMNMAGPLESFSQTLLPTTPLSASSLGSALFPGFQAPQQAPVPGSGVSNKLVIHCHKSVMQEDLGRLFDLIPGMEFCDLKRDYSTGESKGIAAVVYNATGAAIYAKEKLNGFNYPFGYPLIIQYAPDSFDAPQQAPQQPKYLDQREQYMQDTPAPAPVRSSGISGELQQPNLAHLPMPQPLAATTAECVMRLFFVMDGIGYLSEELVKNLFSRFGDLIDVYILRGKNFGYAKYANAQSAKQAINELNGVNIKGITLKVVEAEPPRESSSQASRKRPRT